MKKSSFVVFTLAICLVACTSSKPPSVFALERYLQAFVQKDEQHLVASVCADYEMDALLEFDAFALAETRLEGLSCEQISINGDLATVVCQGSMDASYGNEVRAFDLSERVYMMIDRRGEWLVCGYSD